MDKPRDPVLRHPKARRGESDRSIHDMVHRGVSSVLNSTSTFGRSRRTESIFVPNGSDLFLSRGIVQGHVICWSNPSDDVTQNGANQRTKFASAYVSPQGVHFLNGR